MAAFVASELLHQDSTTPVLVVLLHSHCWCLWSQQRPYDSHSRFQGYAPRESPTISIQASRAACFRTMAFKLVDSNPMLHLTFCRTGHPPKTQPNCTFMNCIYHHQQTNHIKAVWVWPHNMLTRMMTFQRTGHPQNTTKSWVHELHVISSPAHQTHQSRPWVWSHNVPTHMMTFQTTSAHFNTVS